MRKTALLRYIPTQTTARRKARSYLCVRCVRGEIFVPYIDATQLGHAFDLCWEEDESELLDRFDLEPFLDFSDHGAAFDMDDAMSMMAMEIFDMKDSLDLAMPDEVAVVNQHRTAKDKDASLASSMAKIKANGGKSKANSRTSKWKGVTRHKITSKWEAHLWDATYVRKKQNGTKSNSRRRGRQVYLGGYLDEESAARAYDLASLRYFGPRSSLNFAIDNYKNEMKVMYEYSRESWVAELRRGSSGFSRGKSAFRGVTSHKDGKGKWEARIGRVMGNKYLYLGTFPTEREAAEAYDMAAIHFRGHTKAVTNFDRSNYDEEDIAGFCKSCL